MNSKLTAEKIAAAPSEAPHAQNTFDKTIELKLLKDRRSLEANELRRLQEAMDYQYPTGGVDEALHQTQSENKSAKAELNRLEKSLKDLQGSRDKPLAQLDAKNKASLKKEQHDLGDLDFRIQGVRARSHDWELQK